MPEPDPGGIPRMENQDLTPCVISSRGGLGGEGRGPTRAGDDGGGAEPAPRANRARARRDAQPRRSARKAPGHAPVDAVGYDAAGIFVLNREEVFPGYGLSWRKIAATVRRGIRRSSSGHRPAPRSRPGARRARAADGRGRRGARRAPRPAVRDGAPRDAVGAGRSGLRGRAPRRRDEPRERRARRLRRGGRGDAAPLRGRGCDRRREGDPLPPLRPEGAPGGAAAARAGNPGAVGCHRVARHPRLGRRGLLPPALRDRWGLLRSHPSSPTEGWGSSSRTCRGRGAWRR